jgi:hypothetical protein
MVTVISISSKEAKMNITPRQLGDTITKAIVALHNVASGGLMIRHRAGIGVNYTLACVTENFTGKPPITIDVEYDGDVSVTELVEALHRHRHHRVIIFNCGINSFKCERIVHLLKLAAERNTIKVPKWLGNSESDFEFEFKSLVVFVLNSQLKYIPASLVDRCVAIQVL